MTSVLSSLKSGVLPESVFVPGTTFDNAIYEWMTEGPRPRLVCISKSSVDIGMELGGDSPPIIQSLKRLGPAQTAGAKKGDRCLAINGILTLNLSGKTLYDLLQTCEDDYIKLLLLEPSHPRLFLPRTVPRWNQPHIDDFGFLLSEYIDEDLNFEVSADSKAVEVAVDVAVVVDLEVGEENEGEKGLHIQDDGLNGSCHSSSSGKYEEEQTVSKNAERESGLEQLTREGDIKKKSPNMTLFDESNSSQQLHQNMISVQEHEHTASHLAEKSQAQKKQDLGAFIQ